MSTFAISCGNGKKAFIYVSEGGSLLAEGSVQDGQILAVDGRKFVTSADSTRVYAVGSYSNLYAIVKDQAGNTMFAGTIYPGRTDLAVTTTVETGTSVDPISAPRVRAAADRMSRILEGLVKKDASTSSATLLHIAQGYRPGSDVKGLAVLDGASTVPVTVSELGPVTITAASWQTANVRAFWNV